MKNRNLVFIATSLDGYISDKNGGLDWLNSIPNPEKLDMGYNQFVEKIDAIVMGRKTLETVCSFDCDWPYTKPVFVISNSLKSLPEKCKGKAEVVNGSLSKIIKQINKKGHYQLYIDGGTTVQNFLKEDLIDEICITTIPIMLGGGTPLFKDLPKELDFEFVKSELYLDQVLQNTYRRKR